MPDLGSRESSPPTTCQVFLGWLQGEGHLEPLIQFKQEELDCLLVCLMLDHLLKLYFISVFK